MSVKRLLAASAALFLAAAIGARPAAAPAQAPADRLTADVLKGLEFRSIGPAIATGRGQDIAIDPKSASTRYVAPAFGGLWKTTNRASDVPRAGRLRLDGDLLHAAGRDG